MKRLQLFRRAAILIALGSVIGACPLQGQSISYFRQFTPEIGWTSAITVDASGIYITGNRTSPQGGPVSSGIRKCDFSGSELWTRAFNSSNGTGVTLIRAATHANGIYVLGNMSTSSGAGVLRSTVLEATNFGLGNWNLLPLIWQRLLRACISPAETSRPTQPTCANTIVTAPSCGPAGSAIPITYTDPSALS